MLKRFSIKSNINITKNNYLKIQSNYFLVIKFKLNRIISLLSA
ncbi:hypothetical protein FM106_04120 [Brachybacterium faecium]|nr:hypothetical protein FM106_04120 [Brachybacterium faecium]